MCYSQLKLDELVEGNNHAYIIYIYTVDSKINGTHRALGCLLAHFEATFYFSCSEITCT